jgi:hypothetical protein
MIILEAGRSPHRPYLRAATATFLLATNNHVLYFVINNFVIIQNKNNAKFKYGDLQIVWYSREWFSFDVEEDDVPAWKKGYAWWQNINVIVLTNGWLARARCTKLNPLSHTSKSSIAQSNNCNVRIN